MPTEAEGSGISVSTSLSQDTMLKVLDFARRRGLYRVMRYKDLLGKRKDVREPNVSEAIRTILNEYFLEESDGR